MSVKPIITEGITVRYNSINVLQDISFTVNKGDYIGLVGPNGSGKTTLIKTILGLIKPIKGRVELFGNSPENFTKWDKIGYLPQKFDSSKLTFPTTVEEIIALGLLSKKTFPKWINKQDKIAIDRVMENLKIIDIRKELFSTLSRGQQQRVLVARTIVNDPELLLLDEPTTALDPEIREEFFSSMGRLNAERGSTIVLVTHDIGSIGGYASKLLYLDKEIVFYGSFGEFCRSESMSSYFGKASQHIICHQHD